MGSGLWATPAGRSTRGTGDPGGGPDHRVRHRRSAHSRHVGLPRCIGAAIAACPRLSDRCDAGRVDEPGGFADAQSAGLPPVEPHVPGTRRKLKPFEDIDLLVAAHSYSAANWLAMHCRRHMELYGTTKEQLGWLAINSRRNAGLNPRAAYRDPMTMNDYLSSRPVSTPIRTVRLRRTGRRSHRAGGLTRRLRRRLPESAGGGGGDRRGIRLGRLVSP